MEPINVLIVPREPLTEALINQVRGVSPRLQVAVAQTRSFADLGEPLAEAEVLLTAVGLPTALQASRLRWVQAYSAGVDGWLAAAGDMLKTVILTNASGIHAPIMAEYSLSMLL